MKYDLLVKKMITSGHKHSDFSESMQRCHDYIKALEEERRKIQVFQRELPLCLELVTQAIETCKQQLSGTTTQAECNLRGQSECSEQTTSDVPVLEEFIPMKRASSDSDGEEQDSKKPKNEMSDCDNEGKNSSEKNCKKSDWLRSVQLWNNQSPDPTYKEVQDSSRKSTVSKAKRNGRGGAFIPFKKERGVASDGHASQAVAMPASTSSTAENGSGSKKESQRKARRCWSPELHRRFLQALQQLGGSHVATPKQIREFMKVDGLTNDEVKSHLQKYRLHTRRPSPSTNNNAQTPQFVVVGGLWVPHASMATNTTPTDAAGGAPIAAPPPTFQEPPPSPKQKQHIKPSLQSNYSKGSAHSCSPATSSSSVHTTTAVSPAC